MTTRTQPIYAQLADAVIERERSRGVPALPHTTDTAVKAMLASTDFSLYFAAKASAKFGLDVQLTLDNEHVTGLPGLAKSREGLELAALVLADIRKRERGGNDPDGGRPTFNLDDYLTAMPHLVPDRSNWRNPDPGGGAGARPVEYEIRKAA
jgi:hypothetical protein